MVLNIDLINVVFGSILAAICAWTDIKSRTIYNKHTYTAAIIGLIYCIATKQYSHLYGALIILAMYLFLFISGKGKLGGGDLKLAVALTFFIGYEAIIYGSMLSGVIMMLYGFVSTYCRTGQLQTATYVVLGKVPGGEVPYGAMLGLVSVLIATLLTLI